MSAFSITKSYSDGNPLTEAMIDNFRSALLTLLNTTKLDSGNFVAGITFSIGKFADTRLTRTDGDDLTFGTDDDGVIEVDSNKDLIFNTTTGTGVSILFKAVSKELKFNTSSVNVPGDVTLGKGGADFSLLKIAGQAYRKPVLEFASTSAINTQQNSATTNQTVIVFPTTIAAVTETADANSVSRQASITNTANGYSVSHSGTVRGGRRSGVSLTNNSWYTVYAVTVKAGTQYSATSAKFVLVFDTTLPTPENESALDGYYGTGEWVYMGLIRYGYGAIGTASSIIKFKQSNKGWTYFTGNDSGAVQGPLRLALTTSNTDGTVYTLTQGMGTTDVPAIITHAQFGVQREAVSEWQVKDTGGLVWWQGGWQTQADNMPHGFMLEIPVYASMVFSHVRKGLGALSTKVALLGFCDGYLAARRQGKGI